MVINVDIFDALTRPVFDRSKSRYCAEFEPRLENDIYIDIWGREFNNVVSVLASRHNVCTSGKTSREIRR
jgi:hypothetical protein